MSSHWLTIKHVILSEISDTVQPRLSGPRLSGPSIIRTSWRPEYTLPLMRIRRGQWSIVGVVTDWVMNYGLCRLTLGKTGLLDYFSEHCWPWSCCIGIVYRLGIINQVRNVGTSVIWTLHLSGMAGSACGQRGPDNRGCTVICTTHCNMLKFVYLPSNNPCTVAAIIKFT